jgi:type IV secretion system protein VirB5
MSFPFGAPARSYAPPEADTPYRRARQEWDARMGAAVLSARAWRRLAFCTLALSAALAGAVTIVALQQRTFVKVVEVSPEGAVLSVRTLADAWSPTDAQEAFFIGRFVRLVRGVPTDPVVLRDNWLEAYKFLTPQAAAQLTARARDDDPFAQIGQMARSVHVRSIVMRSPQTWQVSWAEETSGTAVMEPRAVYTGLFTIRTERPRTADQIASNPLGVFITDFSWSRDR